MLECLNLQNSKTAHFSAALFLQINFQKPSGFGWFGCWWVFGRKWQQGTSSCLHPADGSDASQKLTSVWLLLITAGHRATQTAAGVQAAAGKCFRKQTSAFAFCVLIFSRYWNKQRATLAWTQEDLWSISGRRVTPGQACSWRVSGS